MQWEPKEYMSMEDQARKYKYVVYIEGNCGWADRLKTQLALGMTILLQENFCHEFFLPLLRPWVHYIPVQNDLSDLVDKLRWAHSHPTEAREIGLNAAEFAHRHLSRKSWRLYFELTLDKYAGLMRYEPVKRQNAVRFKKGKICRKTKDNLCFVDRAFENL
jgi:hypothetical protein